MARRLPGNQQARSGVFKHVRTRDKGRSHGMLLLHNVQQFARARRQADRIYRASRQRRLSLLTLLAAALGAPAAEGKEARVMTKQFMSVVEAAQTLIESANQMSEEEFELLAGQMLEDNSPGEIEAIGAYMPPVLRELLPKRTLH
jgi:hypothetical protein